MSKPSTLPETARQAGTWEATKTHYLRAGLCFKCAAQAAYGHQQGSGGFGSLRRPCPGCVGMKLPDWLVEKHGTRAQDWLMMRLVEDEDGGTKPEYSPGVIQSAQQERIRALQAKAEEPDRPTGTIWHPKCGKSWTGKSAEHCDVCCQTFSGSSAGDLHRRGPGDARRCVSPESIGLKYDETRDLWRLPGTWRPEGPGGG
jgi:hypothetical protein